MIDFRSAFRRFKHFASQDIWDLELTSVSFVRRQVVKLVRILHLTLKGARVALLIGGLFLCVRRTASWEIPAGVLLATWSLAELFHWAGSTPLDGLQHLLGGAAMLGAFFIATDPVTSPLTPKGKFLFGAGIGLLMVLIRIFSGYSEGLMFAVLLMNAVVPLINRWTIPTPLGGLVPQEP